MNEVTAILKARALLGELGVERYPVDVRMIARKRGFEIRYSDKLKPGESGQLIPIGDRKVIVVNVNENLYRQRFTILHEIGHEELTLPSNHGVAVSIQQLESYISRPEEEILCDIFAAECLVPWNLLSPLIDGVEYNIETIKDLGEKFQASISCVASRFAQGSPGMHIFVLEERGTIRSVIASASVRELGFWINRGTRLHSTAAALKARQAGAFEAVSDSDGTDWSSSNCAMNFYCTEEAIYLRSWDQSITLLTLEKARSAGRNSSDTDPEADALLPELTGELPWPGRRRRK